MIPMSPKIKDIVAACTQLGGRAVLVGGAVRDHIMGIASKDWDIELYGLESAKVESLLARFGTVIFVGKSFGVFRVAGLDVDFSLPRSDSGGRKPDVFIDPFMTYHDALLRRDLTMNAMGIDLATGELIDPFNGQNDIKNKILRTPDAKFFIQDPLRFFRVMQFIGRFEMSPDDQLNAVCKTMDITSLSIERIVDELEKLFLRSARPSLGLRWIARVERLQEIFPELYATMGVPQRPDFHPEGDVFEHTMQALDAAASYQYSDDNQKLRIMYAALCHDLGKIAKTELVDGVYRSFGHARAGVVFTKKLLSRMTIRTRIKEAVPKLVTFHMEPFSFIKNHAKAAAYKRLASRLAPQTNLFDLALLHRADRQGRNGAAKTPLLDDISENRAFITYAQQYGVLHQPEEPLLHGVDVAHLVPPGPAMGRLLQRAYELQIEHGIVDKQELIKRVSSLSCVTSISSLKW